MRFTIRSVMLKQTCSLFLHSLSQLIIVFENTSFIFFFLISRRQEVFNRWGSTLRRRMRIDRSQFTSSLADWGRPEFTLIFCISRQTQLFCIRGGKSSIKSCKGSEWMVKPQLKLTHTHTHTHTHTLSSAYCSVASLFILIAVNVADVCEYVLLSLVTLCWC